MKTPDEIKKALECCFYDSAQCGECPYYPVSCDRELVRDAREYIRQLESKLECSQMTIDGLTATLLKCDTIIKQLQTERDAALETIYEMAKCITEDVCEWCDQTECERLCMMHATERPGFKWRGVQKKG